jgi:hypothetical protein
MKHLPYSLAIGLILLLAAAPAVAASPAAQDVWLIDTRCAPQCGDLAAGRGQIAYWRLDCNPEQGDSPHLPERPEGCFAQMGTVPFFPRWVRANAGQFSANDPSAPTVIFLHGNRTDADTAIEEAMCLLSVLRASAGARPFRFVIWSWPSDRVPGARRDAQVKACRSDTEAYYLARCLASVRPGTPLGLMGYSFGCRAIGGALELLAGGQIADFRLPPEVCTTWRELAAPVRVAWMAAAMDADWIRPGARNDQVLPRVQAMLVTCNCGDRVLRWYPRLYGRGGPQALGRVGPPQADDKLEVIDVAPYVGRAHNWYLYAQAAPLVCRLPWYAFLADAAPTSISSKPIRPLRPTIVSVSR